MRKKRNQYENMKKVNRHQVIKTYATRDKNSELKRWMGLFTINKKLWEKCRVFKL